MGIAPNISQAILICSEERFHRTSSWFRTLQTTAFMVIKLLGCFHGSQACLDHILFHEDFQNGPGVQNIHGRGQHFLVILHALEITYVFLIWWSFFRKRMPTIAMIKPHLYFSPEFPTLIFRVIQRKLVISLDLVHQFWFAQNPPGGSYLWRVWRVEHLLWSFQSKEIWLLSACPNLVKLFFVSLIKTRNKHVFRPKTIRIVNIHEGYDMWKMPSK